MISSENYAWIIDRQRYWGSSIPRIIRINHVTGFKVYCAFNNGEHRIIDFTKLFEKLNFKRDKMRRKIMNPKLFKTVTLLSNTLAWKKVRKQIITKSGKTFNVAFDLDPIVLYENSESDAKRNEPYKIGKLIKEERENAGITQQELASKCGTTRNYISRIENNRSDIELRTLRKIIEIGLGRKLEIAVK